MFAIRLPNGQRIKESFSKDSKAKEIYEFVYIQEKKGFEDEDHDFEIFTSSFPPEKIENSELLKKYFGESDQEALTVRELFE